MGNQHAQKVSFYLERTVGERLADLARAGDRTFSAELRRACREHVASSKGFSATSSGPPAGVAGPAAPAGPPLREDE